MTAAYPALPGGARGWQGPGSGGGSRPAAEGRGGRGWAWPFGGRLGTGTGAGLGALPGAEHCARVFAGVAVQVPEARAFVSRVLAGCPARETLLICVTELCANAVTHTASGKGGVFTVEVVRPGDGVAYVAVTDGGGPGEPVVRSAAGAGGDGEDGTAGDDLAEGGRGLALVEACSSRWGYWNVTNPDSGRTVWAEATWPVAVRTMPGPDQGIWQDERVTITPDGGVA